MSSCAATANKRRNLTNHPADDREPAWSADGKRILFTSDRTGNEDIWSFDLDSETLQQLTTDPGADHSPAALGDSVVFFSARNTKPGLYRGGGRTAPSTSAFELLHAAPAGKVYAPRVSPDGEHLAFVQAVNRNGFPGVALNALVVLNLGSGEQRTLSAPGQDVFSRPPAWLDNDTLLATIDGRIQRFDLRDNTGTTIPFSAQLPLRRIPADFRPRQPAAFSHDPQPMLGIVDPVLMPDDSIVFTAARRPVAAAHRRHADPADR